MNRILLAEAMKLSPSSSGFRERVMASFRYGLTDGSYNSDLISLTPLGVAATKPRNDYERIEAERDAFRHVPIFSTLLDHYSNSKLPDAKFLKNTLERAPFDIDPAWSAEVVEFFIANATRVGFLRLMNGSNYVVIEAGAKSPDDSSQPQPEPDQDPQFDSTALQSNTPNGEEPALPPVVEIPAQAPRAVPMQIFIAHGKSKKPLEQLKKILNEWQVPFLVAVDEPNAGRPISEKVADLMRACTAGIFIFTADDELQDSKGNSVFRPSQNVVYELGAASLLYGRKIVVLKDSNVTFPSDFSDLGWIEFERDALDAKALDLLRELIALKAIRLVSTTSE
jgi:hypothetical protein